MVPKILLADDHSMTRKGVRVIFEYNLGISSINEVGSCKALLKELEQNEYTHLLLDINFSDGSSLEILPEIRRKYPELRMAILTMQPASVYLNVIKKFGVKWFISKDALTEDTTTSLRKFLLDADDDRTGTAANSRAKPFSKIHPRELEILNYWLQGSGTKAISTKLGITMTTVSTVKATILRKTGTNNIIELKELVARIGLFDLSNTSEL
jgi:two-component system, NarL family, invasion response regulator UvrY